MSTVFASPCRVLSGEPEALPLYETSPRVTRSDASSRRSEIDPHTSQT